MYKINYRRPPGPLWRSVIASNLSRCIDDIPAPDGSKNDCAGDLQLSPRGMCCPHQ